jgi:hypothetical protein
VRAVVAEKCGETAKTLRIFGCHWRCALGALKGELMTTVIAYLSKQGGKPSAVNLVSDSQISWKNHDGGVAASFKYSQKLFALRQSPVMFGYCGDSLFGLGILSQLLTTLDASSDFVTAGTIQDQSHFVLGTLNFAATEYPFPSDLASTKILQVSRIGRQFFLFEYSYNHTSKSFEGTQVCAKSSDSSEMLGAWGSGRDAFNDIRIDMVAKNGSYSRNYFRSLVLQLNYHCDSFSGGAPQMMVLGLKRTAIPVGVRVGSQTYLSGMPYCVGVPLPGIEFRNEFYELVTESGQIYSGNPTYEFQDWKPGG